MAINYNNISSKDEVEAMLGMQAIYESSREYFMNRFSEHLSSKLATRVSAKFFELWLEEASKRSESVLVTSRGDRLNRLGFSRIT